MTRFLLISCAALSVAALSASRPAGAQYYDRGPPPPYRYDEAPPPPPDGYRGERPYYEQRVRFGRRCEATAETPNGGRAVICPIRPRPLGEGCECPPPPPPPGFSYGPPLPGRVVR